MNFIIHIATLVQIFGLYTNICISQRVPPGVHPNHYQQQQQFQQQPQYQQQQQQQPQYQQQQPQYQQQQQQQQPPQYQQQQVPVHQQQVPMQQQQVPINPNIQQGHVPPVQQQPPQQNKHHAHHQSGKILDTQHIMEEKEHIAEHLEVPMDTSKMSEQELQFHYFKMHDADNNNKLDGCELIKSLIHWHEQGSKDPGMQNQVEDKIFNDDELITLIDPILNMDDNNRDGYIDYPEFIKAQQKVATQNRP